MGQGRCRLCPSMEPAQVCGDQVCEEEEEEEEEDDAFDQRRVPNP